MPHAAAPLGTVYGMMVCGLNESDGSSPVSAPSAGPEPRSAVPPRTTTRPSTCTRARPTRRRPSSSAFQPAKGPEDVVFLIAIPLHLRRWIRRPQSRRRRAEPVAAHRRWSRPHDSVVPLKYVLFAGAGLKGMSGGEFCLATGSTTAGQLRKLRDCPWPRSSREASGPLPSNGSRRMRHWSNWVGAVAVWDCCRVYVELDVSGIRVRALPGDRRVQ